MYFFKQFVPLHINWYVLENLICLLPTLLFQLKNPPGKERALDCGAGIGRITKHLLTNFFRKVDLVEPVKPFIDEARNYIQNDDKIGDLYNVGKFKMKWISNLV